MISLVSGRTSVETCVLSFVIENDRLLIDTLAKITRMWSKLGRAELAEDGNGFCKS